MRSMQRRLTSRAPATGLRTRSALASRCRRAANGISGDNPSRGAARPSPALGGAPLRRREGRAELPAVATIPLLRIDPLNVAVAPAGRAIRVFVDNPAKGAFDGAVRLVADGKTAAENALRIQKGEAKAEVLGAQPRERFQRAFADWL